MQRENAQNILFFFSLLRLSPFVLVTGELRVGRMMEVRVSGGGVGGVVGEVGQCPVCGFM